MKQRPSGYDCGQRRVFEWPGPPRHEEAMWQPDSVCLSLTVQNRLVKATDRSEFRQYLDDHGIGQATGGHWAVRVRQRRYRLTCRGFSSPLNLTNCRVTLSHGVSHKSCAAVAGSPVQRGLDGQCFFFGDRVRPALGGRVLRRGRAAVCPGTSHELRVGRRWIENELKTHLFLSAFRRIHPSHE